MLNDLIYYKSTTTNFVFVQKKTKQQITTSKQQIVIFQDIDAYVYRNGRSVAKIKIRHHSP